MHRYCTTDLYRNGIRWNQRVFEKEFNNMKENDMVSGGLTELENPTMRSETPSETQDVTQSE